LSLISYYHRLYYFFKIQDDNRTPSCKKKPTKPLLISMVLGRLTTGGAAVGRGAAVATQEIPSLHSGEPEPKEAVVISTQVDLREVQAPYDDDVVAMNSRSPS